MKSDLNAFRFLALVTVMTLALASCGPQATPTAAPTEAPTTAATEAPATEAPTSAATEAPAATQAATGDNEGEVAIVDWPGYIERGANDPNYDWVPGFEQETGCKVNVKDAATSDEMVQLMNSGGFDLVTASGD